MPTPVIVIPGTFWKDSPGWATTYALEQKPMQHITRIFGTLPQIFDWPGGNSAKHRHAAAVQLADTLPNEVHLIGFSHGGNIAAEAAALTNKVDFLVTIATPVTGNYRSGGARRHLHLYNPRDRMQILGGEGIFGLPALARRTFPKAYNVAIESVTGRSFTGSHGNILWCDETWVKLADWTAAPHNSHLFE